METIAILECKQISFSSFKNEITHKTKVLQTLIILLTMYSYLIQIINAQQYDFFWFYCISNIVDYLMPNPLYTYILNIYDLVWLGFMAYKPL